MTFYLFVAAMSSRVFIIKIRKMKTMRSVISCVGHPVADVNKSKDELRATGYVDDGEDDGVLHNVFAQVLI